MNKLRSRIVTGILAASIMLSNCIISANAEEVSVSVINNPKIDIVLTPGETAADLSNFETDIIAALQNNGIGTEDASIIKVEAIKTNQTDIQNSFTWYQDLSSTIGNITTTSNGVTMRGNTTYLGKNCVYAFPSLQGNKYEFNYSYNIAFGDSFNSAGMLLKLDKSVDGKTLTGYMLSFNNAGTCRSVSGTTAAVWKFNWTIGTNTSNIIFKNSTGTPTANTAYLVKSLAINTSGKLNVVVEKNEITISGGGLSSTTVTTEDSYGGSGFGFYSDHYSHGCDQIGQFTLSGITLDVTQKKTFSEVLLEPSWRDDAYHVIVNVDDILSEAFTNETTRGEILSRTLADEIYYVQWGTSINKSLMESFIQQNDNNGKFIYNTNYQTAVDDTAAYIKSILPKSSDSQYVIVGSENNISVNPTSLKTNAVSTDYPSGRWKIQHISDYYPNSEGQSAETEVYQKNLTCSFDKPGKYKIYFDDALVKEIYAHRAPIADFNIGISGTAITLESTSYDLDSQKDTGYGTGIASEQWYYKEATETNWEEGKLATFTKNKIYMIKLEVTDEQGTTSSTVKYVGTGAPVAKFSLESSEINTADTLVITDSSYDPQGNDITKYEWTLRKNGALIGIYTTKTPSVTNFNAENLGEGNYTYSLKITNSVGTESEVFIQSFTVETAKYKNIYKHWLWGLKNKEGNNITKDGFLLQTTYGEEIYESNFTPNISYALTVPNGFYLQQKFGTNQITGTYDLFNFGTTLTQPAYVMNFEYDYYPNTYTITYNLDGGINNSNNPDTYNVLYGVTFETPTKKGYDFVGWYDSNGNKVTGINVGCDAKFSDTADLYSKLSTRTTGNIEVTAKWELHDYTIDTNYTGSGVISNDTKVTFQEDTSIFIVPAEGYDFTSLKIDGVSVSPISNYGFWNVESDHTVEATFSMTQTKKMELLSKMCDWIDLKLN